jgi:outer membrane protein assembly factor BamB
MYFYYSLIRKSIWLVATLTVLLTMRWTGESKDSETNNGLTFLDTTDGKVFTQNGAGRFSAIDAESGSVLWSFYDANLRLFTRAVFSSGALFVAATSSKSNSELIRFDSRTGKTDWRAPVRGLGGNASPVLCGGEVLVADYWHKNLSAFNVSTGQKDWTTELQPFLFLFPPGVLDDRALFLVADKNAPESNQQLVSISCAEGKLGKRLAVQIEGVSRTPLLLYKESVVLSGYDSVRGTSLAETRMSDGTQIWTALIPDEITRFTPTIQNNLLIAGGASLWVVDLDTGKVAWHEALPGPTVPVAATNELAFSSRGIQTIEAHELLSGKLRWSTKLKGRISSNIAVTDSHVYVKTGEAQLAALKMTGDVDRYIQIAGSGRPAAPSH